MGEKERKITDITDVKEEVEYVIYSRDVVHAHSKAIRDFLNLYIHHLEDAFEARRNGAKVVITAFTDPCFLYACDAIPIEFPNIVRLGKMESARKAEELFQIPAEVCPMSKGEIGGFYEFRNDVDRLVIGSRGCELQFAIKSLIEQLGYQVFVFDETKRSKRDSQDTNQLARDFYREELEREAKWVNGKGINKEKLHEEIVRANRLCDKSAYLEKLQRKHPSYMGCLPAMLVIAGRAGYFGQPERYEEAVDAIIAEFEALPEGSYSEKRTEMIWSGVRGVDFSVYTAIDILGGCITAWTIAGSGYRKYNEEIDPVEAYLDFVFGNEGDAGVGSGIKGIKEDCREAEMLYNKMGASGVFIYMTQGCTHLTMNMEMRRQYLSERGIPVLALTGTTQIGEATGQMMTRIKAFIEMIS